MIWNKKQNKKTEDGSVVIETTLTLSIFMFLIVIILSIVNITVAQAKIAVALNETAEEMSQYLYFYSLSGLNGIQGKMYADSNATREQISGIENEIIDGIDTLKSFGSGDTSVNDTINSLSNNVSDVSSIVEEIVNCDDKAAWFKSLAKVAANEGFEVIKGTVAGSISKGLMVKHLGADGIGDCDKSLKKMGVVNGLSGLNMNYSSIYTNGTEDITLICKYDVRVLDFFGQDFKFSFVQSAKTKAWGAQALLSSKLSEDPSNATEGSIVLVGEENGDKFGEYARKAKPEPGYVDVIIHTDSNNNMVIYQNGQWTKITGKNLARYLQANPAYNGENIRLISCGAGSVDNGVAQSVADNLGVTVKAPTDTVWAYPDGKLVVGPDASTASGDWVDVAPHKGKGK